MRQPQITELATLYDEVIAFIPSISCLVCKLCESAVPRDALKHHLYRHREQIRRGLIAALLRDIDHHYRDAVRSTDALFSQAYQPALSAGPLPFLPILSGYLRCGLHFAVDAAASDKGLGKARACRYITKSLKSMESHCREAHHWVRPKKAERHKKLSFRSSTSDSAL